MSTPYDDLLEQLPQVSASRPPPAPSPEFGVAPQPLDEHPDAQPAPRPAPAASPSPGGETGYDDLLAQLPKSADVETARREEEDRKSTYLRYTLANDKRDPGQVAETLRLATALGWTPEQVERDVPAARAAADASGVDMQAVLSAHPALAQFLADPKTAPLARGDTAALTGLSYLIGDIGWEGPKPFDPRPDDAPEGGLAVKTPGILQLFAQQAALGREIRSLQAELLGETVQKTTQEANQQLKPGDKAPPNGLPVRVWLPPVKEKTPEERDALREQIRAKTEELAKLRRYGDGVDDLPAVKRVFARALRTLSDMALPMAGGYVASAVPVPGTAPLYWANDVRPGVHWMLSELRDPETGKPVLSDKEAAEFSGVASLGIGAVMAGGLGAMGVQGRSALMQSPAVQKIIAQALPASAAKVFAKQGLAQAVTRAALEYGKHAAEGGVMMAAQSAIEAASAEAARATHGGHADLGHITDAASEGFVTGLTDFALISAWAPMRGLFAEVGQLRRSTESARVLKDIEKGTQESKLAKTDPGAFAKLIESFGEGKSVFLEHRAVLELAQEEKVPARELGAELVGDRGESFDQAAASGGALEIPLSRWAEKVVLSGRAGKLARDARVSLDEMTPRQMEERATAREKELADKLEARGLSFEQEVRDLRETLTRAALRVGQSRDQAAAFADINARVVSSVALRTDQSVRDTMVRVGLPRLHLEGRNVLTGELRAEPRPSPAKAEPVEAAAPGVAPAPELAPVEAPAVSDGNRNADLLVELRKELALTPEEERAIGLTPHQKLATSLGHSERGLTELERRFELWLRDAASEDGHGLVEGEVTDDHRTNLWPDFVDHVRRTEPDLLTDYWGSTAEPRGVAYFASGSNEPGEIRALARAGQHLGVSVNRLRPKAIAVLKALKGLDVKVFVDSGAFGEVEPTFPFPVKKAITEREWDGRLGVMKELAKALGDQLYVVAPDRVAEQSTTLELMKRYAKTIRAMERAGANIIVPMQMNAIGPGLPRAEFWRRATKELGVKHPIAGLPSKKAAATVDEIAVFARDAQPERVHLLGLGPNARDGRFHLVVDAIATVSPGTKVFCDSVMLQGMRGQDRQGVTRHKNEFKAAGVEGSDALTEEATLQAVLDRQAGGEARLTAANRGELRRLDKLTGDYVPASELHDAIRSETDPARATARDMTDATVRLAAGAERGFLTDGTFDIEAAAEGIVGSQDSELEQGIMEAHGGKWLRGSGLPPEGVRAHDVVAAHLAGKHGVGQHATVLGAEGKQSVYSGDMQWKDIADAKAWADAAKYLEPVVDDVNKQTLRWKQQGEDAAGLVRLSLSGKPLKLAGNDKMQYPNDAYPGGRNTWDDFGCGRRPWALLNALSEIVSCYGGKCYADAIAKGKNGKESDVTAGIRPIALHKNDSRRARIIEAYKAGGIEAARAVHPEVTVTELTAAQQRQKAREGKDTSVPLSFKVVPADAQPTIVYTNLQKAKGQDIRLGVDSDGGAWLSNPEVMDAILAAEPRILSVYSSAYHAPPPPHALSGRTIINVTVSGWHPIGETFSRLRWAEEARANGWNVILREVVADPAVFGEEKASVYNRLHDGLIKTGFFVMQQPLHEGNKHGKELWGLPGCCKGSAKNAHKCDQCEVAEGLGNRFQAHWGIAEEGDKPAERILPDVADYRGRQLGREIGAGTVQLGRDGDRLTAPMVNAGETRADLSPIVKGETPVAITAEGAHIAYATEEAVLEQADPRGVTVGGSDDAFRLQHPESPLALHVERAGGVLRAVLQGFDASTPETKENIEKHGGQGYSTALYIRALEEAKKAGAGFESDWIRTNATERMYERLRRLEIPFQLGQSSDGKDRFSISARELAKVDLDRSWRILLAEAEIKRLREGVLYSQTSSRRRGTIRFRLGDTGAPIDFDIRALNGDASTLAHETGHFLSWSLHELAMAPGSPDGIRADYLRLLTYAGWSGAEERLSDNIERSTLARKAKRTEADQARLTELAAKEERLSHAWEQYLGEGKAPSRELAVPFARYRRWMKEVYSNLTGIGAQYRALYGRDLELSDEVRGVFDRLLASDSEVERMRADDAKADVATVVPLTPAEQDELRRLREAKYAEAAHNLYANMTSHQGSAGEALNAERERIRSDVHDEVSARREHVALDFLSTGELRTEDGHYFDRSQLPDAYLGEDGQPLRLSRESAVEVLGDVDSVKALERQGVLAREGGVSADELAPLFGYDSGQALVEALAYAPKKEWAVEDETKARFEEAFGPELHKHDGVLRAMGAEAASGPSEIREALFIRHALARELGLGSKGMLDDKTLMMSADRINRGTLIRTLSPKHYLDAERQASRRAFDLAAKAARAREAGRQEEGDTFYRQALHEWDSVLLNKALWRDATAKLNKVEAAAEKLKRSAKTPWMQRLGKADIAYSDAHTSILRALGFAGDGQPADSSVRTGGVLSIVRALLAMERDGGEVSRDPETDAVESTLWDSAAVRELVMNDARWERLTFEEGMNVLDAVENISAVAGRKNKLTLKDAAIEKTQLLDELELSASRLAPTPEPRDPRAGGAVTRTWRRLAGYGKSLDANLTELESLVERLVGNDRSSPVWQLLVGERLRARDREVELTKRFGEALKGLWDGLPAEMQAARDKVVEGVEKRLPLPDTQGVLDPSSRMTRGQLWMIALNLGNAGNRQRLLDGYGWREADVLDVLREHMSRAEWEWVEGVWRSLRDLYPMIVDVHVKDQGLRPSEVEATPFWVRTSDGDLMHLEGGYFPARYDPRVPGKAGAGEKQVADSVAALLTPSYRKPKTVTAHAKARAQKVTDLLNLDFDVVPAHFAQVIHDVTHRLYVKEAASVILDPRFKSIVKARLGQEYSSQFPEWLKSVASQYATATDPMGRVDSLLSWAKSRATLMSVGFNVGVPLADLTNPLVAVAGGDVGAAAMARVTIKLATDWKEQRAFALENSPELRARAEHGNSLGVNLQNVVRNRGYLGEVEHAAYWMMEASDRMTATPVWLAKFHERLAETGNHDDAVRDADAVVRKYFPSTGASEKAAWLRSRGAMGAVTYLYGFGSKVYNMNRRTITGALDKWRDPGSTGYDRARAIGSAMAVIALQSAIVGSAGEFMAGRGPGKDDDGKTRALWTLESMAATAAQSIPLVNLVEGGRGRGALPARRLVESLYREGQRIANGDAGRAEVVGALGAAACGGAGFNQLTKTGQYIDEGLSTHLRRGQYRRAASGLAFGERNKVTPINIGAR